MVEILFVCTGNICRSPTAEGVFRHYVRAAGLADRIAADSAGTHGYHTGEPPDERATLAAARRGFDLSDIRARPVTREDLRRFDLVVAMDRGHLGLLRRLAPDAEAGRLRLFMEFAPDHGVLDVPDPYYGGAEGFERVLDMIEAGAAGLLDHIRETRL